MGSRKEMIASGTYVTEAVAVNGSFEYAVAATGTTQATAYKMSANNMVVTTVTAGTNDGVILPVGDQGDWLQIFNYSAAALKVYPPVGWGIHGGAVNTPITISANKAASFTQMTDPNRGALPAGFSRHEFSYCLSA
jgi:hypothetical protein